MGVTTTTNSAVTYVPIQTTTLNSTQFITFSSIPQTYTDLVTVLQGTNSQAGVSAVFRLNGDTGSNYSMTYMYGNGTSAGSGRNSNTTYGIIHDFQVGLSTTELFTAVTHFLNYANTTTYKTVISRGNRAGAIVDTGVSLWRGSSGSATQAITSITLMSNGGSGFQSGTTATLYGILAA